MSFISQPFLPLWHGRPSASPDHAQDSCSAKSTFRQKSSSSTIPQSCCAQTTLCIPIFQFENENLKKKLPCCNIHCPLLLLFKFSSQLLCIFLTNNQNLKKKKFRCLDCLVTIKVMFTRFVVSV